MHPLINPRDLVQTFPSETSRSAVEVGVTEGKDAAVRRYFPVTTTVGRGGDPDDWFVQLMSAHRSVEVGVTEGKDAAVGCDFDVTVPINRRDNADNGLVELRPAH